MRYLSLIFFIFLSLHSYFVFADGSPIPSCVSQQNYNNLLRTKIAQTQNACLANPSTNSYFTIVDDRNGGETVHGRCEGDCTCPTGSTWYQHYDINANSTSGCVEDLPDTGTPPDSCDESEKVYDPVSGSMVCPGSGDGSSSSSSQSCVVPGDYNGDCIPDEEQGSSAANSSSPTSSGNASSSGSDGNPDGGDDGSGSNNGGSGNNNGGGSTGGGSASSAASSAAGAGECDPTSKYYFTCITSQKLDGSDNENPWTPVSGYGNWIPVSADSPCPNKYQDASGNWWCAGDSQNGSGSGGAAGSSGSAASAGSGSSASGECDPTSPNYLKCISGELSSAGSSTSAGSSVSSASSQNSSARSGAFSSLGTKGEFDDEIRDEKLEDLTEQLENKIADIKDDVYATVGGSISGQGSIQDFCKTVRSVEVCFGMKKFEAYLEPIGAAIFLVACVLAFVIVLRG